MRTNTKQRLGTVIFLVGLLLGLALAVAAIWGDYEALSYFYTGAVYDQFGGMSCPILMSRSEAATISATFDNPSDKLIRPFYQVEVSGIASPRDFEEQIDVPPRSSKTVRWTVDASDLDLGSFIMVRMDILRVAGFSTRETTCGIVVLNLTGLNGAWILGLWLAASLTGMVVGLGLRESAAEPVGGTAINMRNGLRAAGVTTSLAMLTGFAGLWLIGVIFCAITILLVAILLRLAAT